MVAEKRPRNKWRTLSKLAFSVFLTMFFGELFCRLLLAAQLEASRDERNLAYIHDRQLGWRPQASSTHKIQGSVVFTARHNAMGFRDAEWPQSSEKPILLVLGDSFVWGYDVERSARFTERLQAQLTDWRVVNCGVSGYGTDQAYLLSERLVPKLKPKTALLVVSYNDVHDNAHNQVYGGYFKPTYDELSQQWRGQPVPRSWNYQFLNRPVYRYSYLARACAKLASAPWDENSVAADPYRRSRALFQLMRDLMKRQGCSLLIGLQPRDAKLEAIFKELKLPVVELSGAERFKTHGCHWTEAGHRDVAARLLKALKGPAGSPK